MKKKLYEIAVLDRTVDHDRELLIPPTPVMANDEDSAKYKAAFIAKEKFSDLNTDRIEILVRLFQKG